jgi:hypothetical protein
MKPPSSEELEEQERKLQDLDKLLEDQKQQSQTTELQELSISQQVEYPLIDIQLEMAQLLKGYPEKTDEALAKLLGGSFYWNIRKNNLYYLAYTKQQQLENDGARLLYFQPAEHYRQLDPLSEIEAQY